MTESEHEHELQTILDKLKEETGGDSKKAAELFVFRYKEMRPELVVKVLRESGALHKKMEEFIGETSQKNPEITSAEELAEKAAAELKERKRHKTTRH